MRRLKLQIIFLVIFCLPGLAVVGVAAKRAVDGMSLRASGVSTLGTIVGYEQQSRFRPRVGHRYCPIVRFAHAGAGHQFTDSWCNKDRSDFPEGTSVPVRFDAVDPIHARIDDFGSLYGASLFMAAIGTPWLLLGIALVVRVR